MGDFLFRPIIKKGDTIGLVAPSGCVPPERVEPAVKAVEELGFNVKIGKTCRLSHGYLAGTDEERASDINEMFADKSVNGIFAMRGGYGAQRLLELLDYRMIRKNAKVFAGYSDITALHTVFNMLGFVTYHSPMPATQFYKETDDYTMESFLKSVMDPKPYGKISNPDDMEIKILNEGFCEGVITGGNLSLLASSIGTNYEPDMRGKVLFIEEIGEEPYKIDRMLTQLKLAGKLQVCAGFIFGAFTNCEPIETKDSGNFSIAEIIAETIMPILPKGRPILYNLACGHCLPTLTIPMGSRVRIDGGEIFFL